MWKALSDTLDTKPMEEDRFCGQARRLRALMALHFTNKITLITTQAEDVVKDIKKGFCLEDDRDYMETDA